MLQHADSHLRSILSANHPRHLEPYRSHSLVPTIDIQARGVSKATIPARRPAALADFHATISTTAGALQTSDLESDSPEREPLSAEADPLFV